MTEMTAEQIRTELRMLPHPEGGHYVETYRDERGPAPRGNSTAIYFLLEAGETSHWHRVRDASEIWHHYAGDSLSLTLSQNGQETKTYRLGKNILEGERPQIVVPADCWQTAMSLGQWTLVGCTVAPGFEFSSFELAPADWHPGQADL